MKLSAVIITKNEEKNITACLESLSWCNEVIVIDSDSTDKTKEEARKIGAMVYTHKLEDNFSNLRNFGLKVAKNNWVFFVDADERVSNSLKEEIIKTLNENKYDGFYLRRDDFMWGKLLQHGETRDVRLLRLANKTKGAWVGRVHEIWNIKGRIGELKNKLTHYPHPKLSEFLDEIQKYSDLRVKELFKKKEKVSWFQIISYPTGKFFINYFLRMGFLDGTEGLVFAIIMSLHSFLIRSRLWLLYNK